MASKRSEGDAVSASRRDPTGPSPALLAVATVAAVAIAEGLRGCLRRTSQLARDMQALTVIARTDPLTGLPNRRDVEEHLAAALSGARRHQQPLSVLFIDIDNFKRINDESGYEAGDEVLRAVGDQVRHSLRAEDVAGRWGGEEFLAVLPSTDLAGAVAVAERVRAAVAARRIKLDTGDVRVTVSLGCACGPTTPAVLVRQASHALRQAKHSGKNQVVAAGPGDA